MSLIQEILESIEKITLNYKGVRVDILGLPKFKKYRKQRMYTAVFRLQKKNLIQKELSGWILTQSGKDYLRRKQDSLKQFKFNFSKDASKNLIVMFDIPETQKAEREWFRFQLKKGGYVMIQKSVWVGPSPLPKDFMNYVRAINLRSAIKTFKLAKSYTP